MNNTKYHLKPLPRNLDLLPSSIKMLPELSKLEGGLDNDNYQYGLEPLPGDLTIEPTKMNDTFSKEVIAHAKKHWWEWGNSDSDSDVDDSDVDDSDVDDGSDVDNITEADIFAYYQHHYPDKTENDLNKKFWNDTATLEGLKSLYRDIRTYKRYVRAVRRETRRKEKRQKSLEDREKKKAVQTKKEAEKKEKEEKPESTTPHTTSYTPIDKGVRV